MFNGRKYYQLVLAITLLHLAPFAGHASAKNWNTTSGNWNTAANWSPASVPTNGEVVNIVNSDGTARTVTLDVNAPSSGNLGLVTINQTGGTAFNTLAINNNFALTSSAMFVGGWNGAPSAGRGAVTQSTGTVTMAAGSDLVVGYGAGSTGTYTLSGGNLLANQSEFIGSIGSGTFTQMGGTNSLPASAVGYLNLGTSVGGVGTYNLSGGNLIVTKNEIVGDAGTGIFNQTGGTNTILGGFNLNLGNSNGGSGTYTISNNATLTVANNLYVGNSGTAVGTLNIQNNSSVWVTNAFWFYDHGTVNLSGGTLRFGLYVPAGGIFNYTGGTVQLSGNKTIGLDDTIQLIYGPIPTIPTGKGLTIEGVSNIRSDVNISGGKLTIKNNGGPAIADVGIGWVSDTPTVTVSADGDLTYENGNLRLADSGLPATLHVTGSGSTATISNDFYVGYNNTGHLQIDSAGVVTNNGNAAIATSVAGGDATLTGQGSTWNIGGNLTVGTAGAGTLNVNSGATVSVGSVLTVNSQSTVNINGGTLRLVGLNTAAANFHYNYGTIVLAGGTRTIGSDPVISQIFGSAAVLTAGRNLTIEGSAILNEPLTLNGGTLRATGLALNSTFQFSGGVLQIDGGSIVNASSLSIPSGGELRIAGTAAMPIAGAAGSTITCTGITALGSSASVNGFGTQGNVIVGQTVLTLQDANDVVFDALSYTSIGNGVNGGVINATNGLTLNFGGNIVGVGNINSTNISTKPLINNGHIVGNTSLQKITLNGYVKGVGTFDNVTTTGTFSPGLSPAVVSTTNLTVGLTGTLLMELGGTTAGSGYDQLQDAGTLTVGGILQIALINGFTPAAGQSFDLLNWGSLNGTFSTLDLPTLAGGLSWNTSQLYTTGVLSVVGAGLAGDYNNNGVVDAADYVLWRENPSGYGGSPAGYNTWRANFGQTAGSGAGSSLDASSTAVPEPAGSVSLLFAAFLLSGIRKSKSS